MAKPEARGRLRHIAIAVPDLETAALFYERTFGLERLDKQETPDRGNAIILSDGTINLTLLNFPTDDLAGDERGKDYVGLHHIGFVVDDMKQAGQDVVKNGGHVHIEKRKGAEEKKKEEGSGFEVKYRDPNGVVFDVSYNWIGIKQH